MQAQQQQQQGHQQIGGTNVILKMNEIQQLSTVGESMRRKKPSIIANHSLNSYNFFFCPLKQTKKKKKKIIYKIYMYIKVSLNITDIDLHNPFFQKLREYIF